MVAMTEAVAEQIVRSSTVRHFFLYNDPERLNVGYKKGADSRMNSRLGDSCQQSACLFKDEGPSLSPRTYIKRPERGGTLL